MMSLPTDAELDQLVFEHLKNLSEILELTRHLEDSLSRSFDESDCYYPMLLGLGRLLLAKTRHNLPGNSCAVSSTSYNMQSMSTRGATTRALVTEESFPLFGSHEFSSTRFQLIDELAQDRLKSDTYADPIRWFSGVLIPATLRRAQTCFRRAVDLSINLANRRAKLLASSRELQRLIALRLESDKPCLIDYTTPDQCGPVNNLPEPSMS